MTQPASLEQTADLWLKIDQFHLNFLSAEESTKKIEMRKKLEGFVHQYLCLVPQERKFCSQLTSDILFESAQWVPEFSIVKAAQAFEVLEKYAANLMTQPWRPEFKEIKEYGGFYKLKIDSVLYAPSRIFQAMGYRCNGAHSLVMDGQVDMDKLTTVARDCLLAYGECQIALSIFQGISRKMSWTGSWQDILAFRKNYIGGPEQAVQSLMYEKNQQKYQVTISNKGLHSQVGLPETSAMESKAITGKLIDFSDDRVSPKPNANGKDIMDANSNAQIPLTIKTLEEENLRKSQLFGQPSDSWDYVYDQLERMGYSKDQSERPDVLALLAKVARRKREEEFRLSQQQQQQPPAQSLSPLSKEEIDLLKKIQRDTSNQNEGITQRPSYAEVLGAGQNCDEVDAVHHRFRRNSGNGSGISSRSKKIPIKNSVVDHKKSTRHSQPLEPPNLNAPDKNMNQAVLSQKSTDAQNNLVVADEENWECFACTFSNCGKERICEMCGKSRDSPDLMNNRPPTVNSSTEDSSSYADEADGGVACYKCTLVNTNGVKICIACGATLSKKR